MSKQVVFAHQTKGSYNPPLTESEFCPPILFPLPIKSGYNIQIFLI